MAEQACTRCGEKFTPKPGPGRPRRRCFKCRPPETRRPDAPALTAVAPVSAPNSIPEPASPAAELVATVRSELARVGRLTTAQGAITMALAETLAAGGHTAQGVAALAKQLHASLDAAVKGAETGPADPVDELEERRQTKARGA